MYSIFINFIIFHSLSLIFVHVYLFFLYFSLFFSLFFPFFFFLLSLFFSFLHSFSSLLFPSLPLFFSQSIYKICASDVYVAVAGPKGTILILSLPGLEIVHEYKNQNIDGRSDVWCREIKFSPDGLVLVTSDIDKIVTIFTVNPSALQGGSAPPVEEDGEVSP